MSWRLILSIICISAFSVQSSLGVSFPDSYKVTPKNAPFLVSIWTIDPNTNARNEKICSGLLLTQDLVLTAAHCVVDNQDLAVITGQSSIEDRGEVLSVFRWVIHPRYSKKSIQNDIAIGILNFRSRYIKSFPEVSVGTFSKNTRLFGWGQNQNEQDVTSAMSVRQKNYSAVASKYYSNFNPKTQIAGGFYNTTERVFAGACYGDSGGPLISKKGNSYELVGIVSYGAKSCDTRKPTIYTNAIFYSKWIVDSAKALAKEMIETPGITRPDADMFSSLPDASINLPVLSGSFGNYTTAYVQAGNVGLSDFHQIMLQTYSSGLPFGINFYLSNELDGCIIKQKSNWMIQIALDSRQRIDFQFSLPSSRDCFDIDKAYSNLTNVQIRPPAREFCANPLVKIWNSKDSQSKKANVVSFYFNKACIADAESVWIRALHQIDGELGDIEPGNDMWAGSFSTKINLLNSLP